jgi:hypothetical protein
MSGVGEYQLLIAGRVVIPHEVGFDFKPCLPVILQTDTDAVCLVPSDILVVGFVELFGKVVGLTDKNMFMDDFVHLVGMSVCYKKNTANLFEHGSHRKNVETVLFPRFSGECNF